MAKVGTHRNRVIENGELVRDDLKSFTIQVANQEQFFMTYSKFMAPIFDIKSINDVKVLGLLCLMMDYTTTKVYLTTERREEICTKAGIANSVLSRSLSSLKALGIISGDKGTLEISPFIFWKGGTKDRMDFLTKGGAELRLKFKIPEELEAGKIYPNYRFDE